MNPLKKYNAEIDAGKFGKIRFSVWHNLSNTFGASIDDAFQNWLFRTQMFTARSFCKYVMSKDPSFICVTETQFERLNKLGT